ncbi:MAG TPA: heavy metal-binding domain-containing protein [Pyrinomonadaceae bacterium]|nr:heavy metal-binding domain-containing protein [Pyrinomonadaceae bacterium]
MSRIFVTLLLAAFLIFPYAPSRSVGAQSQPSYVCPMHADVTSSKPGTCSRCGMNLVARRATAKSQWNSKVRRRNGRGRARRKSKTQTETVATRLAAPPRSFAEMSTAERLKELERLAPTYEYTCVMHRDVRQAQEGTCPRCGMPLTSVKPSVLGEYELELAAKPLASKAGEKVQLRFVVKHPQTGARVRDYVLNHEKLFHLFIVSQDMTEYQHIHPVLERDGSFVVETVLPRAGLYKIHADFFPVGGQLQVLHRELSTVGQRRAPRMPVSAAALTPDTTLFKTVDGMRISLDLGGSIAPAAGSLVSLKYHLTDERTGEPVRNLEPYLGAWGHTLILNADQSEYLHSHPTEMLPDNVDRATLSGGPDVEFRAMFPAPGDYRIWTQFQRAGKVTTVFFTVRVGS